MESLPAIIENKKLEILALAEKSAITTTIQNAEVALRVGFMLQQLKGYQKDLKALRESITKPLETEKKSIIALFKTPERRLDEIEAALKSALLDWDKRERARIEAEQKALDDSAEEAAATTKSALLKEAEMLEDDWNFDEAQNLRAAAQEVSAPSIVLPEPKTLNHGLSKRVLWRARVVDPLAVPREWLMVDEKRLGEFARSTKGEASIAGVEFYAEEILSARG